MRLGVDGMIIILIASFAFSCKQHKGFQELRDRKSATIQELQKQQTSTLGLERHSENTKTVDVDFRFAASKVTPAVVHVNSLWKAERGDDQYDNPFKDFFGDDFKFWFEPFRQRGPLEGSASGVIVTNDGYIITNNHVIDGADEIEVILYDQRSYKATLVGADPETDIALLRIDEKNLSFISFGNSDNVEVGEWVLAVGNPFNLASTVTAGIVSAKARNINILRNREAIESFIQTDAAVNPGNSGGALVDLSGELIGINTAIATPTGTYAGYSFAVPVNIVKKVADDLSKYGSVQRGYLGVTIRDMTGSLAKNKNIEFVPGVYVDSLVSHGAAMEGGIKAGDIIIQINDSKVETSPQLQEIVASHRPGEKLKIDIVRGGKEREVIVTLKGKMAEPKIENREAASFLKLLGIEVTEISDKEKRATGLSGGLKVVRITKGKIEDYTNMKVGFIITKIDGRAVRTKNELAEAIKDYKAGGIMIEGIYPGLSGVIYYGFGI